MSERHTTLYKVTFRRGNGSFRSWASCRRARTEFKRAMYGRQREPVSETAPHMSGVGRGVSASTPCVGEKREDVSETKPCAIWAMQERQKDFYEVTNLSQVSGNRCTPGWLVPLVRTDTRCTRPRTCSSSARARPTRPSREYMRTGQSLVSTTFPLN